MEKYRIGIPTQISSKTDPKALNLRETIFSRNMCLTDRQTSRKMKYTFHNPPKGESEVVLFFEICYLEGFSWGQFYGGNLLANVT